MKRTSAGFFVTVLTLASTSAVAHTTIAPTNNPQSFNDRVVLEGTSGVLNMINISHGCAAGEGDDARAVTAQAVVFPNGPHAQAALEDSQEPVAFGDFFEGNAIMAPSAIQDRQIFRSIQLKRGQVSAFNHHGMRDNDTRAFHFSRGYLQPDLVGRVPFTASFPRFKPESCATSLKVRVAIANYCTFSRSSADRADIWMGNTTQLFNDESVVSVGFWPTLTVVRDTENNPLPEACGDGVALVVEPAAEDVDTFLPIKGYWPSSDGIGRHWPNPGDETEAEPPVPDPTTEPEAPTELEPSGHSH